MFWRKKLRPHPLDEVLLQWTARDVFRVRDLLNGGVLIIGRTGSGKTSSSGAALMEAIINANAEDQK
jgi:hypothetical protein